MDISIQELLHLQSLKTEFEVDAEMWSVELDEAEPELDEEELVRSSVANAQNRNYLTNNQRKQLILELFSKCNTDYSLKKDIIKKVAEKFNSNRFTVGKLWKDALRQLKAGDDVKIFTHKQNCGRKYLCVTDEVLREMPLNQRTTMRSFATTLHVSSSTVYRMIQRGFIRSHFNSIKSKLTDKHKTERLKFTLSFIVPTLVREKPRFDMLYNMIHIDEKWFFMTKTTQRFYLLTEEEDPYRSCQSKSFIMKVMFMGAIAKPWLEHNDEVLWDGKIGIFLFSEEVPAKRTSQNKPRGTIETKPLQHITKEIIRGKIIDVLMPQIREKWPNWGCKTIWIQQDNARPHIQPNDAKFLEVAKVDEFEMMIVQQPP